ncbi:MFS transporter [Smaragdicoccus niigatensis]|uniref:MFS transporter n=1 Tax=Smaragdicoccus niigatensis TaxID=359359 RepID=UPI00037604F9|nr:MFS transporter [Smaragdicoccus niigatensis]
MQEPLFTAGFIKLMIADLAYFLCFGIGIYTLPLFVVGPIGGGRAAAGFAVGAFSVTALFLRPLAGALADAIGRRPMMIGGTLLAALATGGLMFVDSFWPVILLRIITGVAEAAFFVAGFAALADLAPAHRLAEALSYNSLSLYLGLAIGPVLGQVLVSRSGFAGAWLGAAVFGLIAVVATYVFPETSTATGRLDLSWKHVINRPAFGPSVALFCGIFGAGAFLAFAVIRARDIPMENPSLVLFVYGGVVVLCRVALAKLADHANPMRIGAIGLLFVAAGLVVAASTMSALALISGAVLLAVGTSLTTPAFFAAAFSRVPPEDRGAASGTASIFIDLGLGGGPIVAGLITEQASLTAAFLACAVLAAIGFGFSAAVRNDVVQS